MDVFVKKFFPNFDAPGLPFVELEPGMINHTYMHGIFETKPPYYSQQKSVYSFQPMTMLGRTSADINTTTSSIDGLGKPFVTPNGKFNISYIIDNLRFMGDDVEQKMRSWSWKDNHTTLLVNALRYVLITKTIETSDDIDNKLPEFNDGKIRIDPNYYMRTTTDSHWDTDEWPAGADIGNYPQITRLSQGIPDMPYHAINLRGMDMVQARFIVLMLGAWKSRSNLRLDFDLPKLADNIYYRADGELPGLAGWLYETTATDQNPDIPPPPCSRIAWSALTKYVNTNRLYDHFSAALYIVTSLMYQMVPPTADGQIWFSYNWRVSLPAFASIRGRFTFVNDDVDAAYGHRRALDEWSYIGNRLEKIHLMAMVFVQAIQTGLAIRSVRMASEDEPEPEDLYSSYQNFYSPYNMISAAAAEAIRSPVPLPGMHGVFVQVEYDFDVFNADRRIPTLNHTDDYIDTYVTHVENDIVYIAAPWTTFAGVPTLILPLNYSFPYNSPFTLKGELNKEIGEHQFLGFRVRGFDAWFLTTIVRLAGYEIKASNICSEPCQTKEYHYIDLAKMTWPVLYDPKNVIGSFVFLSKQEEVADMKGMILPPIDSKYFDEPVPYETRIKRRGISSSAFTRGSKLDVKEYGVPVLSLNGEELHYRVEKSAKAFITRDDCDFRIIEEIGRYKEQKPRKPRNPRGVLKGGNYKKL